MKQCLKFFLIGLLLPPFGAMAQRSDVSVGVAPVHVLDGFGGNAQLNFHHKMNDFIQASFLVAAAKEVAPKSGVEYPKNNYLFNLGYFTTAYSSPNGGLSLFIGGGASVGQESINNGSPELEDGSLLLLKGGFVYGGFLSLDLDYFLNDSLSMSFPINGYYHAGSEIDPAMFAVGIGLRYYLN
ncbi:MAG: conjugal transfer protein TraO [Bacteroidota bacterium]